MTLTFKLDLDMIKINQQAKCHLVHKLLYTQQQML